MISEDWQHWRSGCRNGEAFWDFKGHLDTVLATGDNLLGKLAATSNLAGTEERPRGGRRSRWPLTANLAVPPATSKCACAKRSPQARRKAAAKRASSGEDVHDFRGLLEQLGTPAMNRIEPSGPGKAGIRRPRLADADPSEGAAAA